MDVRKLIDGAAAIDGSYARTARRLSVPPQRLHEWKTGARPIPNDVVLILAATCGLDPAATLVQLTVEQAPPNRATMLREALGKLAHGAAVTLVCGAIAVALGAWNGRAVERFFPAR